MSKASDGATTTGGDIVTGFIVLDGWAGVRRHKVEVIGQTPKRYRIKAITRTKLAGRNRWLDVGKTALVPKYAVRDNCEVCKGERGGVPGNENRIGGLVICDYCHAARVMKGRAK